MELKPVYENNTHSVHKSFEGGKFYVKNKRTQVIGFKSADVYLCNGVADAAEQHIMVEELHLIDEFNGNYGGDE